MRIGDSAAFGTVLLNLDENQDKLQNIVSELSSGLSVQTAADDPSGYAIAAKLQTLSSSLNAGTQSIQNASNAINVAQGAMTQITDILDRMHTLFVEANSDINSTADLQDIQSEIDQLTQEIDHIAETTQFNGLNLLNGSLTSQQPNDTNTLIYGSNPTTAEGQSLINVTNTQANPGTPPISFEFTVDSYDASTNMLTVSYSADGTDPTFGPEQTATFQVAAGTNYPAGFPGFEPATNQISNESGSINYITFEFNPISAQDVGLTAIVTDVPAQNYTPGSGLSVNTGDAEGDTIVSQIPNVNSYNLGVAGLSVSNDVLTAGGEAAITNALTTITSLSAQLGAQSDALSDAMSDNDVYQNQLTQSASNITDLNVGQATTEYTATQILVSVGTSVVAQMQTNTEQTTALLIQAIVA